ncbi:hypothetical protein ABEB36_014528 [Hypothenemus hampei]|uniref:Myb-like domain-containing protein n=1 Tax=Hypothenemus hampei TaxID=57062 RepID=A0ABD1E2C0_HYPHA
MSMRNLQEFLILPEDDIIQEETPYSNGTFSWSVNGTKLLIDLYKKYVKNVGKLEMKNLKSMWTKIANEISTTLQVNITTKQCHNRWKVLDRNYKKWVENKNATGRGRKCFEFSNEMDEVYGKKKNVHPTLLLESETINIPSDENFKKGNVESDVVNGADLSTPSTSKGVRNEERGEIVRKRNVKKKKTILEKLREDKLNYQKERMELFRKSYERIIALLEEKNDIERERNEILKKQGL